MASSPAAGAILPAPVVRPRRFSERPPPRPTAGARPRRGCRARPARPRTRPGPRRPRRRPGPGAAPSGRLCRSSRTPPRGVTAERHVVVEADAHPDADRRDPRHGPSIRHRVTSAIGTSREPPEPDVDQHVVPDPAYAPVLGRHAKGRTAGTAGTGSRCGRGSRVVHRRIDAYVICRGREVARRLSLGPPAPAAQDTAIEREGRRVRPGPREPGTVDHRTIEEQSNNEPPPTATTDRPAPYPGGRSLLCVSAAPSPRASGSRTGRRRGHAAAVGNPPAAAHA